MFDFASSCLYEVEYLIIHLFRFNLGFSCYSTHVLSWFLGSSSTTPQLERYSAVDEEEQEAEEADELKMSPP
jgi:hypothetical protein